MARMQMLERLVLPVEIPQVQTQHFNNLELKKKLYPSLLPVNAHEPKNFVKKSIKKHKPTR